MFLCPHRLRKHECSSDNTQDMYQEREIKPSYRTGKGIVPIDKREQIRRHPDCHGRFTEALLCILKEVGAHNILNGSYEFPVARYCIRFLPPVVYEILIIHVLPQRYFPPEFVISELSPRIGHTLNSASPVMGQNSKQKLRGQASNLQPSG